jgi:hypothetical protein
MTGKAWRFDRRAFFMAETAAIIIFQPKSLPFGRHIRMFLGFFVAHASGRRNFRLPVVKK